MAPIRTAFLAAAAASLLAAGCGGDDAGGDGEPDSAEATVEAFYAAAAEGDSEKACAELTPRAERQMQFLLQSLLAAGQPCTEAVEEAPDEIRELMSKNEVVGSREEGDRTVVEVKDPEAIVAQKIFVVQEGDDWKIDGQNIGSGGD